jgi:Rap guanine nucleotide exchange factor 4
VFCPGDEGLFWYTVISGNLEMLQGDLDTNKVNSVCSLGEGSSFGESVIFGNKRETMIVTTDHCQLLCVEANHIKHIYTSHTESMKHLIHSRGRPFSLSDLGSNTNNSIPSPDCTDGVDEPQMSTPVFSVPESDMTLAGLTLLQIVNEHFNDLICDHQINLYTYHKCSSGKKLVDWVISQSLVSRSRQQVVSMWQALLCEGIIEHVLNDHQFYDDDNIFYRFVDRDIPDSAKLLIRPTSPGNESKLKLTANRESVTDSPEMSRSSTFASISSSGVENSPGSSPRSSISSLLEECFELISQLGPETLIYSTILKDPKERNEDDLQLIYEELLHVKAFGHLSNAIKEELAAVVRLENHPVAGKFCE